MRIKESNQEKSRYEMNPSKYLIVNDYDNSPVQGGNNLDSANQTYYPKEIKDERIIQREENLRNHVRGRRENPKVYEKDTNPYYGRERPKAFRSDLLNDSVSVDVDLADLSYTFPSAKNLRKLESELQRLEYENKLQLSNNGGTNRDNGSYYDPTIQERQSRILILKERIAKMDYELSHNNKPEVVWEKENSNPQIQNPRNFDREITNKFVADSYFYPVDKQKLANGKIDESLKLSTHGLMEKSKYVDNDKKIEATAESVGEILGNKYITDDPKSTKPVNEKEKSNVNYRQIPKEKEFFIDDGQLIFRPNAQSVKVGGKKDDKNCEKEKYIDTKTVLINSLGKDNYKGTTLMARKGDSGSEEETKTKSEIQNNSGTPASENKIPSPAAESKSATHAPETKSAPAPTKVSTPVAENKVESTPAAANNASINISQKENTPTEKKF
jgi:hypothetical protein